MHCVSGPDQMCHVFPRPEESPLGAIALLREMEARVAKEDVAIEIEDAAAGLAGSSAIVSKYGSVESSGQASMKAVGRRYRRASMTTQFKDKNKGLDLFPVVPVARRKSDVMMAKEIAVQRAKEKVFIACCDNVVLVGCASAWQVVYWCLSADSPVV